MSTPVVSVIMPIYNCISYIAQAIDSILNQTFTDFELIIIDDCSTDGTAGVVDGYTDKRINFITKPKKTGLVASLNTGLSLAKGQYIARMDGDDISAPERLQKQVDFLVQHRDVMLCGTAYELLNARQIVSYPAGHDDIKLALLEYCPLGHPTVMICNDFLQDHNLRYNPDFEAAEDYELWTRLIWLGKAANMPDVLLTYRDHPLQYSNSNKSNQVKNSHLSRINMLAKVWDKASITDPCTREVLFGDHTYSSAVELKEMVDCMQYIITVNTTNNCYDAFKFDGYVTAKKKAAVRRYYLNQAKYTPAVLYRFIKSQAFYRNCLTTTEQLKLSIKCLLYRR